MRRPRLGLWSALLRRDKTSAKISRSREEGDGNGKRPGDDEDGPARPQGAGLIVEELGFGDLDDGDDQGDEIDDDREGAGDLVGHDGGCCAQ